MNPGKKRKRARKSIGSMSVAVPRRRRTVKVSVNKSRRRRARRNPSSGLGRGLLGISLSNIGKSIVPLVLGALGGNIASKHLDADSTTGGITQPWTWKNYLLAFLGSYVTGIVLGVVPVVGDKRTARTMAVNGGMMLILYNLITKTWAAGNETVAGLFGETGAFPSQGQAWRFMKPGQTWRGSDGVNYRLGSDNRWSPMGYLGAARVGDIVDADRYGDIVDADRYMGQAEEAPRSWQETRPAMDDPYYQQYI